MASSKPTVAIVSFIPPYPLTHGGNRQVIYNLVTWLRNNGYRVVYVYQVTGCGGELRDFLENIVDELVVIGEFAQQQSQKRAKRYRHIYTGLKMCQTALVKVSPALAGKLKPLRSFLLDSLPLQRDQKESWPETSKYLRMLARKEKSLAVIAEYIYMTGCLEGLPEHVLTFTHTHDMLSRVGKEIGDRGIDTQGRECSPEDERAALMRSDVIMAMQEEEAKLFKALVPEREVIVLGFAPPVVVDKPNVTVDRNTVFILGGNNPLNRRGMEMFCSRVWPTVLDEVPDARLRAAGHASDAVPSDTKNVEILGPLDDLSEEYLRAAVVVNPVDVGTGLKIKTVEALCYGKALVTTRNGVEGIPVDESICLIADNWDEFAQHVIRLLKDDNLRNSLEHKAVSFAQMHFTPDAVYREFHTCLEKHFR